MVDASGLFDLDGEGKPDVFLSLGLITLLFVIADLTFTGFRTNELGTIITGVLFLTTAIAAVGFFNILKSDGHPLDGALSYTIGIGLFAVIGTITGLQLSLLSTATESYLSGVLQTTGPVLPTIVNSFLAPLGETFLIFGFAAGIYSVVKNIDFLDRQNLLIKFLVVAVPPSILFSILHGARNPSFIALAFSINMVWTAILFYGELREGFLDPLPIGVGAIVGLHQGFNISSGGGFIRFVDVMVQGFSGDAARSSVLILVFIGVSIGFGLFRGYQILSEGDF